MRQAKRIYSIGGSFTCPYCLRTLPISQATREHEPPRSRQTCGNTSQVVLACHKCNHEKGALTAAEYAEWKRLNFIRNGGKIR